MPADDTLSSVSAVEGNIPSAMSGASSARTQYGLPPSMAFDLSFFTCSEASVHLEKDILSPRLGLFPAFPRLTLHGASATVKPNVEYATRKPYNVTYVQDGTARGGVPTPWHRPAKI
jgi:hypothetical protein